MRSLLATLIVMSLTAVVFADGLVKAPAVYNAQPYVGSLQETAQEAIIIFEPGDGQTSAKQDLILKITVEGEVDQFGWIVPLCNPPSETAKADARIFEELHQYVEKRLSAQPRPAKEHMPAAGGVDAVAEEAVEVIERKIVGSYDVAIVREKQAGALNKWLQREGYQTIDDGEDVLDFYRKHDFVFACVKVSDTALDADKAVDLHPLRFTFETGGRDGIYFPMRLTGLQSERFDVNLYVFYNKWVNDNLNGYGYTHRDFSLRWRDYDGPKCKPNAGKRWDTPADDPYLAAYADGMPTVTALFKQLHPGKRYYLTNLQASSLQPTKVRKWPGDLWVFPYYTNRKFVPYDAREGAVAVHAFE